MGVSEAQTMEELHQAWRRDGERRRDLEPDQIWREGSRTERSIGMIYCENRVTRDFLSLLEHLGMRTRIDK